ncbi:MAG: DNA cytosine methyltransferase [Leptospiraceae bacterium]|nr:DNA cytosine methyltransferase [Leptospiraceae bacterium]
MKNSTKFNYIDIFAGCGGLSLGFFNAGWKGVFAVEKNIDAFSTLKFNLIDNKNHFEWPSWLPQKEHDINELTKNYQDELNLLKGKVDLVAGGPPCQGFSLAGRRNLGDTRNELVDSYIKFVELIEPKAVFFENVKGFTHTFNPGSKKEKKFSHYVIEELKRLGYNVYPDLINVAELGLPQRRHRFILIGFKNKNIKPEIFFKRLKENKSKFLKLKNLDDSPSLEEAISDLNTEHGKEVSPDTKTFFSGKYGKPDSKFQAFLRNGYSSKHKLPDSHRIPNHSKFVVNKFSYILKNCEKNKIISEDLKIKFNTKKRTTIPLEGKTQSPTITSLPDDYIHYKEPRTLTVRECARIQSFPDWFEFKGKYTTGGKARKQEVPRYTQVGNAIPPLFAEQCAIVLREILDK